MSDSDEMSDVDNDLRDLMPPDVLRKMLKWKLSATKSKAALKAEKVKSAMLEEQNRSLLEQLATA